MENQDGQRQRRTQEIWSMNEKAREFYAWLNACPFKVWKIQYDSFGKTTVSFIWDENE